MKRIWTWTIALLLALCILPGTAKAAEVVAEGTCGAEGDNLTWVLTDDGVLTISGSGAMTNYVNGEAPWFSNRQNVAAVEIGDSVTSVGDNAFGECDKLVSATLGNGIITIGYNAFSRCTSLESINIPSGVTSIGSSAFLGCSSLRSLEIPEGITRIDYQTFFGCSKLESLKIPDSVTSIGEMAFGDCSSLTGISIPRNVETIEENAFARCSSLSGFEVDESNANFSNDASGVLYNKDQTRLIIAPAQIAGSYVIPDSVTDIDGAAFFGCKNLIEVTIPEGVTEIWWSVFDECTNLVTVAIPESVTGIGAEAFSECSSLTNVSIPSNTVTIGPNAFYGCSSLSEVTIPATVTTIYGCAFADCSSLTGIHVDEANVNYASDASGVLFNKEGTKLIQAPGALTGQYVIPDGVATIGGWAFYGCDDLTCVVISDSVTDIESLAFWECNGLTSLIIPDNVTVVAPCAFADCTNLTSVQYCGDAAVFDIFCYEDYDSARTDPLTIYYPAGNETWAEVILNDYNGVITWIPYKYSITPDGSDTTASGGSDTVTFHCDGELNDFVGVQVDGEPVDASSYTLTEGSTIVTLHADYLNTLSAGEHAVSIEFTDGFAYGSFIVSGDHEHSYTDAVTAPSCTEKGYTTHTCACGDSYTDSYTEPLGHDYVDGICSRCGENEPAEAEVIRIAGEDRIETSMMLANQLKEVLGVTKFDSVIVASALNFPDALTGSYLAAVKNAPILLTYDAVNADVVSYITLNMDYDGTVYILGGESAVSEDFESRLKELDITYKRVAGSDRFGTNLAIMEEAGVSADQPVLIATAVNFADSLSASAAGLPMVLVHDSLRPDQKAFLQTTSRNFVIIGGTAAVSESLEKELKAIGSVTRLAGASRYETSVLVAERFVRNPDAVILAYAKNFPDGLCGGPLAYVLGAPLILTDNVSPSAADEYVKNIKAGIVAGGPILISDETVDLIFDK